METDSRFKIRALPSRREFVQGTLGLAALTTLAAPLRLAYASGTAASGDFAIDFTSLPDSDPYTNSSLTAIDNLPVKVASGTLSPSAASGTPFGLRRYRFNGPITSGSTIRAKIQVGTAAGFDLLHAAVLAADGSGYFFTINTTSVGFAIVDAAGNTAGLASGSSTSAAPGDIFTLEWIPQTNTLNAYLNGVAISGMSIIDTTYTTGLAFGFAFDAENHSLSTVQSFAGDGASVAYTPWVLADFGNLTTDAAVSANGTQSGNFPTNVHATFDGGYGASRSTTYVYPGKTTSLQLSIPQGSDGDPAGGDTGVGKGLFGLIIEFPTAGAAGAYVHAQIRIYFPTNFSFHSSTASVKFLRFRTMDLQGNSQGYNTLLLNDVDSGLWANDGHGGPFHGPTVDGELAYNSEIGGGNVWTTGNANKGVWEEFEFETKLGAGTSGSVKVWQKISGVWTLILTLDGVATLGDPSHVCDAFLLHTYWNGYAPQTQSDYVDRIVVEHDLSKLTQTDAAGNKIIGSSV
jgi:hypothetical protein